MLIDFEYDPDVFELRILHRREYMILEDVVLRLVSSKMVCSIRSFTLISTDGRKPFVAVEEHVLLSFQRHSNQYTTFFTLVAY